MTGAGIATGASGTGVMIFVHIRSRFFADAVRIGGVRGQPAWHGGHGCYHFRPPQYGP